MSSYTHTVTKSVTVPGRVIAPSSALTYSGTSAVAISETIADSSTNLLVNIAFTYADIKSVVILSDQVLTIKTNSTSAPDDTLVLAAGIPVEWQDDSIHANPFSADVTKIYVTNASGSSATLDFAVLNDATP